jgi:hypothetical protein
MFKLVIIIQPEIDQQTFFDGWPEFLNQAEQMPGLERIVTAPVHVHLTGDYQPLMVHELIFDTQQALEKALVSEPGVAAGKVLQKVTGGAVTLVTAGHMEESSENLRTYRARTTPKGE